MYSENELKLARACGVTQVMLDHLKPDGLYKMMVEKAFLNAVL